MIGAGDLATDRRLETDSKLHLTDTPNYTQNRTDQTQVTTSLPRKFSIDFTISAEKGRVWKAQAATTLEPIQRSFEIIGAGAFR